MSPDVSKQPNDLSILDILSGLLSTQSTRDDTLPTVRPRRRQLSPSQLPKRMGRERAASSSQDEEEVYLPDEIILQILSYITLLPPSIAQPTLYTCALLSHQWYTATVPILYARPHLEGSNFTPFVRAICPSINLHVRKSPLASLVKTLDLGRLVHQGSKSITARLLGRTKDNLESFVAPQASFAINCFPALAKCRRLRELNLALVSEAASLSALFNTVRNLPDLVELRLPRSSGFGDAEAVGAIEWPPRLERLFLSGGIDAHFIYGVVHLPRTLKALTVEHCPLLKGGAIRSLLATVADEGIGLRYLKLAYMPRLGESALNGTLARLPELEFLSVSVDYVSQGLLDMENFGCFTPLSLSVLEITNSGDPGLDDKLTPVDILIAMDEGWLPKLRQVRVANSLGWRRAPRDEDTEALDDALREPARRQEVMEIDAPRVGLFELVD